MGSTTPRSTPSIGTSCRLQEARLLVWLGVFDVGVGVSASAAAVDTFFEIDDRASALHACYV